MKRPAPIVVASLAFIQRQHSDVLSFLDDWRQEELNALPYAKENTDVLKGRCQVLKELIELIKQAPELVADPKWQQRQTHTDRSVT